MLIIKRKHGSQRAGAPRPAQVPLCTESRSPHIVIQEHGHFGTPEPTEYLLLEPETMDEIDELFDWLNACKAHLKRKLQA